MVKNNRSQRYKVTATIDGKRKFFYGKTKVEAEEARAKYLEMIRLAPCLDDSITLGQWLAVWLRGAQSTLSANTFESYKFELRNYVLPYMAKRKLVELQPHMFRQLISKLLAKGYSNRTVEYSLAVVRIALRQAVNDGIIPVSPMRGVKLPKKAKTQVEALTKEEAQKLLSVIKNETHYALYFVALHTGLRRSELLGLRISDINVKKSTLSVNQTVLKINNKTIISKTTKNEASRRTITLDPQTLAVIRQQIVRTYKNRMMKPDYQNNNLLFANPDGGPYDPKYISHTANKYGKLAELKHLSFHMLRHTHATLLVQAGVHFKVIQARLGHSTFQQTMDTYSHVTPSIESDIVEKLQNLV